MFEIRFLNYKKNLFANDKSYSKYVTKTNGIDKTTKTLNIPVL